MPNIAFSTAGAAICLSLCIPATALCETRTSLSTHVNHNMEQVWPWRDDARFKAHAIVTDMTEKMWHTEAYGAEIAIHRTEAFAPDLPILVLTDEDGDGRADFYAYFDEKREANTLEFGAFFTEPGKSAPYWLVFNSGPSFIIPKGGDPIYYWINYQFVDRNGDGRFDAYAVNNLDYHRDGQGSATDILWLYDDDYDDGLDRGEHIVDGVALEIPVLDGVLQTRRQGEATYENKFRLGDPIGELANVISADIKTALRDGEKPQVAQTVPPYLKGHVFPSGKTINTANWAKYTVDDLTIRLPADHRWQSEKREDGIQVTGDRQFDWRSNLRTASSILIAKHEYPENFDGRPALELALGYREWEISNMRSYEGPDSNFFLTNVELGDTVVEGKTFHFLRHFHLYDPPEPNGVRRIRQELHLAFPPGWAEKRVFYKIFLMRYCLQEICDNDELDLPDLRQVLGQVSFK